MGTLFHKTNKGTKAKIEDRLTKYDRAIKTAITIVKGIPSCTKTVAEFNTEAEKTKVLARLTLTEASMFTILRAIDQDNTKESARQL